MRYDYYAAYPKLSHSPTPPLHKYHRKTIRITSEQFNDILYINRFRFEYFRLRNPSRTGLISFRFDFRGEY